MLTYVTRRLLALIPLMLGMSVATFILLLFFPGDPVTVLLGDQASSEMAARMREELGLNLPWYTRLLGYLGNLIQGDLGYSLFQQRPVTTIIVERLGATVELAICAMLISIVIGLVLGIVAAMNRGGAIDVGSMLLAQAGMSIPVFWLGIMLVYIFSVKLGWLPSINRGEPILYGVGQLFFGRPAALLDSLSHILLPAVSLGVGAAAIISRLVRASMLEVMGEDLVRTARAKGLSRPAIILVHVLRNALLPIISVIGLRFGVLLAGAVLTEGIFAWPGLGQLTITAVSQRDLPLVQGLLLSFAVMFALVNLLVDLIYSVADPRIRLE
ncbi:ABC transporter permease [Rhizobiaceae sp. 2RAB30]